MLERKTNKVFASTSRSAKWGSQGHPFPSAMVACEKKLLCRAPLGCAVGDSTTFGDHLQLSNVGQCLGKRWEKGKCAAPLDGGAFECQEKQLGFPRWERVVMWEFHFYPCSSPAVFGGIGPCARPCAAQRASPSNSRHLNQIWENDHGVLP